MVFFKSFVTLNVDKAKQGVPPQNHKHLLIETENRHYNCVLAASGGRSYLADNVKYQHEYIANIPSVAL